MANDLSLPSDFAGDGQLFVELDHPPFVLVRTAGSFFYVNFEDPARTQGFYRELVDAWQKVKPEP